MKKSTLALSVAAALGGFGFVSNALAIGEIGPGTTATALAFNDDGIGHTLVFPYFTVQGDNATLINITNTDTQNGKLVKVRFRGAANSDDLFDFQLLLSPGDVWTGALTQSTAGPALLRTSDKSCTLPLGVMSATGSEFATSRVDPRPAKGTVANQTREGYVEVLNMADIPFNASTTSLFYTIKHRSGAADCSPTILEATLGSDYATHALAVAAGMANPTGQLTGDWIILNQANTAAWSGSARALQARGQVPNAPANLLFWPQKFGTPLIPGGLTLLNQVVTADPLLSQGTVVIQQFDLPDMSTPYVTTDGVGINAAVVRADNSSLLLAATALSNQFVTGSGIAAVTDYLFSQPTRRYSVAINYSAGASTDGSIPVAGLLASAIYRPASGLGVGYYTGLNTDPIARQVCVNNITGPGRNSLFDREETTPGIGQNPFVISPNDPGAPTVFSLCGEVAVVSINGISDAVPSALNASVVRSNILLGTGYDTGWMRFDMANGGLGFPIMGSAFMRASNGAVNYGFAWDHKKTRP